jgi:hypothetical protein
MPLFLEVIKVIYKKKKMSFVVSEHWLNFLGRMGSVWEIILSSFFVDPLINMES